MVTWVAVVDLPDLGGPMMVRCSSHHSRYPNNLMLILEAEAVVLVVFIGSRAERIHAFNLGLL